MLAEDTTPTTTPTAPAARAGRRRARLAAPFLVAGLAFLGACGDDDPGTVEPSNQEPLPAQQPEGEEDPTLSGEEDAPGVGTGESGGSGAGAPDSGAGAGSDAGEAGDD